ncbi:hypothetical protein JL720_16723 [Aureococcus anophagefferens]|nr:hypothetical protein JL720_16723 [Aureococcus anophagefferens]
MASRDSLDDGADGSDDEEVKPPNLHLKTQPLSLACHPRRANIFAVGLCDGSVELRDCWGAPGRPALARLVHDEGAARCVAWSGDALVCGFESGAVVAWDCSDDASAGRPRAAMADRDAGSTCTELNRRAVTAQEEARRAIAEASTLRRAVEAQSECSRRRSSLPRSGGLRGGAGPATPPPSPPRLPGGLEARLKSLRMPAGWEAEVRALVADAVHESPSRAADDPVRAVSLDGRAADDPVRAVSLDASPDAAGFVAPAGAPPPVPVVLASEFDYEAYDPGWPRATGDGIEARVRRCEDALRQVELSQDPEVEAPDRRDGAARTSGCLTGFERAVSLVAAKRTQPLEAVAKLIFDAGGPKARGTEPESLGRLTDAALYTGSHKHRFDADGNGRGLDGRDSIPKGKGHIPANAGLQLRRYANAGPMPDFVH